MTTRTTSELELDAISSYGFCPNCHGAVFKIRVRNGCPNLDCFDCGNEWIPTKSRIAEWVERLLS